MVYDIVVIGAGIVGLASSLKLLEKNPSLKLLIIEKEDSIAKHQTGNNSGVIHSGIYYKPGSLKAQNCVRGYKMLLEFCEKNNVEHKICGKVIVAVFPEEIPYMEKLLERGKENGLTGLRRLSREEVKEIEPHVECSAGILVPQTGIIDYKEVAKKYLEIIQNYGGQIQFNQTITGIKIKADYCEVSTENGSFESKFVVTCSGLYSDRIAKMTHPDLPIRIIPFRGEYYKIKKEKRHFVKSLIYPVPDPSFPFLGVHFTRMIDGEVEAGPNAVLAFKREGYSKTSFSVRDTIETFLWKGFHQVVKKNWKTGLGEYYRSLNKRAFVKELQKMIPEIHSDDLEKGGAGVRAQACSKDGGLLDDFYIVEDKRIFHVCNAPSPAATSSLSIGDYISEKVLARL
ncbi:MAG: L-2-hydroxyglutarate oxidase [Ignavibacteriales bacterium]|nr:L-2-hydroxyglutarate oxidase [Ignavibacteriales bacterium]